MEHKHSSRPLYAITGTGHHSQHGKDKIGKAVKLFLGQRQYAFREFSVPGDRNNMGGIVGIDPSSYDHEVVRELKENGGMIGAGGAVAKVQDTKVRIMTAEEAKRGEEV